MIKSNSFVFMEKGEFRTHPAFQQSAENDGGGFIARNAGNTFDLAGNIKALVEQERKQFDENKWRDEEQFNAAEWMSHRLDTQRHQAYLAYGGKRKEEAEFYNTVKYAYNIIAYDAFSDDHKHEVAMNIDTFAGLRDIDTITLSPQQVELLDTLAEATQVPHTPGQNTFSLTPFIKDYSQNDRSGE